MSVNPKQLGYSESPEAEAPPPVIVPEAAPPQAEAVAEADESLYLLGRPKLKSYLNFVHHQALKTPHQDELVEEWQAVRDRIAGLEKTEAGCADDPPIETIKVNEKYEPLLTEFLKDPLIQQGFNTVPTEVAFVELDRLVVYQKNIDLTHVRELQRQLGVSPTEEEVFRLCLPYDHPRPPGKWARLDDDSYVFVSRSNDLRFLGAMPLKPGNVEHYPHPGTLMGVVGLAVGFGSNLLNAIKAEDRVILNNGSHRAYALRAMGYTSVPCIVQHVSNRDELDLVAPSAVRRDPDLYLKHPRPSMLRDYFDPALHRVMPVRRVLRQVKVRFSVSEHYVPVL